MVRIIRESSTSSRVDVGDRVGCIEQRLEIRRVIVHGDLTERMIVAHKNLA